MLRTSQFLGHRTPLSLGSRGDAQRAAVRPWRFSSFLLLFSLLTGGAHAAEIAIVTSSDADPYVQARAAIEKSLSQKGHQTQSLRLGDIPPGGAASMQSDAVIAVGTKAVVSLRDRLPKSVLLVYCLVADPARVGLEGGRPAHGVSASVPIGPQFNLIAEALPHSRSIGMLYSNRSAAGHNQVAEARRALPTGWYLEAVAVDDHHSVARAIEDLLERDIDIVWTVADSAIYDRTTVRSLLLAGLRHRVPVFGYSLAFVRAGALLGVAVDPQRQGEQAAALAHGLLDNGQAGKHKPGWEDPIFETVINLIVADKLSIDIAPRAINQATRVLKP